MKHKAFTITEVLIAALLGSVLLGIGLVFLRRLSSASLSGSSQLQLQLSTRETLRKITPILKMATMPNSQQTAIYSPDIQLTASSITFCSPEDLLDAHPPAFDPRKPFYILLRMRYNPSSQQIILEDVNKPTRYTILANQVSDFQVTRLHRIGLRLQIERQTTIKDSLGNLKPIKYHLIDILQLPE